MSKPYEMVSQIMAERDQLRAELAALKAGQGEAVATISWQQPSCEWTLNMLCEPAVGEGIDVPLYFAPPASADAVSVPRELLKEATDELTYFDKARIKEDKFGLRTTPPRVARLLSKLRALLAQSESKG